MRFTLTTADNKVIVDTNVLISATLPARAQHENALRVLNDWPNQDVRLCTTGQILREYLVVATRPMELNGLSLSAAVASENVAKLKSRMLFLDETALLIKSAPFRGSSLALTNGLVALTCQAEPPHRLG